MDRRLVLMVLRGALVFGVALVVTWLAIPSPVGSLPFIPSPAPALDGPYRQNTALASAQLVAPSLPGPECLTFDENGVAYAGLADGRIVNLQGDTVVDVANTLGRPLGLHVSPRDGTIFVADAERGLLQVTPSTGEVKIIVNEAEGFPFRYPNDIEITHDGVVYFTDSSAVWKHGKDLEDILDQRPSGRVLRYDPDTGSTLVIARELSLANGLALSPDERALYVAETGRYRLWRVWLDGEKRNLKEVVAENLPGFPDNLTVSPRGTLWVAMRSTRKRVIDLVQPYPFFKDAIATLPDGLRPRPVRWGFVLEMSLDGRPLRSLQDPSGDVVATVTTAVERDGRLWLASEYEPGLRVLPLPQAPATADDRVPASAATPETVAPPSPDQGSPTVTE